MISQQDSLARAVPVVLAFAVDTVVPKEPPGQVFVVLRDAAAAPRSHAGLEEPLVAGHRAAGLVAPQGHAADPHILCSALPARSSRTLQCHLAPLVSELVGV